MIRAGTNVEDLFLLAVVPAALLVVFLLPPTIVDAWRLAILDPTVHALFLSHFVHGSTGHLFANLIGYTFLAPLTYALCVSAGRRREFVISFVTFLVAFPPVLSALNVALVRPSIGYGFSGIVMALLGLLTLAVVWHVEARFAGSLDVTDAPLVFFLVVAVITVSAAPPSRLRRIALGLATIAVLVYVSSAAVSLDGLSALVSPHDVRAPGRVELAFAGVLTAVLFPLAAFPPDPTGSGTVLNLYEHALGYCLGFIVPFVTFLVIDRIDQRERQEV